MKTNVIHRAVCGVAALSILATSAIAADIHVPADHATIQGAIDASSDGDTIHIAAGVYSGDRISPDGTARISGKNNLALLGQPGAILRAVPDMPAAIPGDINWRCVLFITRSPNVVLKNLAFQGDQLGDQQMRGMIGALYLDSGGTVENCRFTGFRERVPGTVQWNSWGLRFLNDLNDAPLYDAHAIGNTVEDCYGGISVIGAPNVISYNFLLRDNTVSGIGPTTKDGDLRGIEIALRATGTVKNNSVSGFSYSGKGAELPFGYGLIAYGFGWPGSLAPLDPIRIEGNTFKDNNLDMTILKASAHCPIVNNRIEGSGPGERPAGLWLTGNDVPVRGNDFKNMEEGIRLGAIDPWYDDILGYATNVQIQDNRFTDVDEKIHYQEGATGTETGNLCAPFPDPELEIKTAIMLSWPSFYEDWAVESSDDLIEWNPLDLPLLEMNGSSVISVPANDARKYFRLVEIANP